MENPHGLAILDLLSEAPMTKEELKSALTEKFGDELVFRTCQESAIPFETLLDFFIARGKVIESDGLYTADREKAC